MWQVNTAVKSTFASFFGTKGLFSVLGIHFWVCLSSLWSKTQCCTSIFWPTTSLPRLIVHPLTRKNFTFQPPSPALNITYTVTK